MKGVSLTFFLKFKEADLLKEYEDHKQRLGLVSSKLIGPWKTDITLYEKDIEVKEKELHQIKKIPTSLPRDRVIFINDKENDICSVISDTNIKVISIISISKNKI